MSSEKYEGSRVFGFCYFHYITVCAAQTLVGRGLRDWHYFLLRYMGRKGGGGGEGEAYITQIISSLQPGSNEVR